MPTTAHRTKASELPDTTFASAADVELGLAPVDPAVPVGVPPPPWVPVVPVGVPDGPAVTPPPAVPAVVLREAVAKVVFLLMGIPVPPEEAAVPASVVVKNVGFTMVAFPDGPAIMTAVVAEAEVEVEEDEDVEVEPPVRENVPV